MAHRPSSSPLYELADIEYSENDPARRDPVVTSMIIHPAAQTLGLRCLSYEPSVTPTSVPAFSEAIIQDTSKPRPTSGKIISHIHSPPHSLTLSQKSNTEDLPSSSFHPLARTGVVYEYPDGDGMQSRVTHCPLTDCRYSDD